MNTRTIRYDLSDGIATLTFDQPDSRVNTLCAQWQDDLSDVTARIVREKDAIRGIVLASAKRTFFAGADLKALMRCQSGDGPRQFAEIERMKKNYRTLETLGKPVVSCLNGAALGGGWEVALVGHYRVAVDDPAIRFGLPEVSLGLIPGASGITKMTRLLGLAGAQPFILEGRLFTPREGLELGLLHELVPHAQDLRAAALAWIATHDGSASPVHHPWDDKNYKMPGGTPSDPQMATLLTLAPALLSKTTQGLYPAPHAALAAMVEGAQVDFDTALRIESRYLAQVAVTTVARAMINTFFFNLNAVKADKSRPASPPGQPPEVDLFKPRAIDAFVMEGAAMLGEGIPAAAIENAAVQAGMPAGPLAVLDDNGLTWRVEALEKSRADSGAKGATGQPTHGEWLVERIVREFGRNGRAAGAGFYDYPADHDGKTGQKRLWPDLKPLFERPQTRWNIDELKDRLLYRQAVETARCLHEGVLTSVHDANIGSVYGFGFPAWTGGTMQFIYSLGLDAFSHRCGQLAAQFGAGFELTDAVKATIGQHRPVY